MGMPITLSLSFQDGVGTLVLFRTYTKLALLMQPPFELGEDALNICRASSILRSKGLAGALALQLFQCYSSQPDPEIKSQFWLTV